MDVGEDVPSSAHSTDTMALENAKNSHCISYTSIPNAYCACSSQWCYEPLLNIALFMARMTGLSSYCHNSTTANPYQLCSAGVSSAD